MFDAHPPSDPVALQQSNEFEQALIQLGTPPLRLPDQTLVLQRKFGPLTGRMITRPPAQSPAQMRDILRQVPGRDAVIVAPDAPLHLQQIGAVPLVSPVTRAVLDLTPTDARLAAGLHPKWRNRLRHAQRQNLRVTRQNLPEDTAHWLLQADAGHQRKRGYRSWPVALTLAYAQANRDDAKLFTAYWGREPVAGLVILRHGTGATYHIGHSRASGRISSAHNLLIWSAIIWAKARGLTLLDLGTIDTEGSPGLARFKLGTGARPCPLGGTWLWCLPLTRLLAPLARWDKPLMALR